MKAITIRTIVLLTLFSLCVTARADEKKIDGTWKWESPSFRQGGQPTKNTLKLKQEGEKLTGTYKGRSDSEISDGKIDKDGIFSFVVVRERDGRRSETKYRGKFENDQIKDGKIAFDFGGDARDFDWKPKRDLGINLTGNWKWSRTRDDGSTVESLLKLKQDGDKVTGISIWNQGDEVQLEDAKLKDDQLTFQVTRERDGQKVVSKFSGKVENDQILGQAQVNVNGEDRTFDLDFKKQKE